MPVRFTCSGCETTWTAKGQAHCSACHRTFSSTGVFDAHRTHGRCDVRRQARGEDGIYRGRPSADPWWNRAAA